MRGLFALTALALVGCPAAGPTTGTPSFDLSVHEVSPRPGAAPTSRPSSAPAVAPVVPAARSTDTPATGSVALPSPTPSTPLAVPTPVASPVPPSATEQAQLDAVSTAAGQTIKPQHHIVMSTAEGAFTLVLYPDQAPKACAKFLSLVQGGIYDGTTFHRVIPGFVAQGGDPNSKTKPPGDPSIGFGNYGEPVPDDFKNGLKHLPGAVAFAHSSGANTSNCQFYICLARLTSLDDHYIVFGQVVSGFDAVSRLTPTQSNGTPTGATPDRLLRVTQSD